MLVSSQARAAAHRWLAGVIHADNSARPQVVEEAPGDPYAELLREVEARTGHGALTCTSFNLGGQPIVYTPEDALAAARAMGLDLLAGDGWCVPLSRC
jgi:carbamoyltransferase